MEQENHGLIEKQPEDPRDYVMGGNSPMLKRVRSAERDYTKWLPKHEMQVKTYFDSYGCVSWSALNCLEIIVNQDEGREMDRSDRYTTVMSGTKPGYGNSLVKVGDSIRKHKTVHESVYQFPKAIKEDEFYLPVPEAIQEEAKGWKYKTEYEWVKWGGVRHSQLWDALQYGPIQVTLNYSAMVQNKISEKANHAVTLFKMEQKSPTEYVLHMFDSYSQAIRIVTNPKFYIGAAMRHEIIKDNDMLKLVKGSGSAIYAIGQDSKKYHVEDSMGAVVAGVEAGLWSADIADIADDELSKLPIGATILLFKSLRD